MDEIHACRKPICFMQKVALEAPLAMWPLKQVRQEPVRIVDGKTSASYFIWNFYVKWTKNRTGHSNNKYVCEKHNKQVLSMFEQTIVQDILDEEATEKWLSSRNSRF